MPRCILATPISAWGHVMNDEFQKAALKVVESNLQWQCNRAKDRQYDFCALLIQGLPVFARNGITFPGGEPSGVFDRIEIESLVGTLRLEFTYVLDDEGDICAAAVFTDKPAWTETQERRLLFTAMLSNNGPWKGDDGTVLYSRFDEHSAATIVDAVSRATARRLAYESSRLKTFSAAR